MRVRRIAPGSMAAVWHTTAGLQPGMLLRAVSASSTTVSEGMADHGTVLIDVVDREINYDKALQMVKSTDRPLTLVFESQPAQGASNGYVESVPVSATSNSLLAPATSPPPMQLHRENPGFGGLDETKAALFAMVDHASAAISQAATGVHSSQVGTSGKSGDNPATGNDHGASNDNASDVPGESVMKPATTVSEGVQPRPGLVGKGDLGGSAVAGAGVINLTLVHPGPLGVSFQQHPDPRHRHCAQIKHLIPGGQAILADREGVLRPGLVLLRLAEQDMTQLLTYSAVINCIRSTTKRPVVLSFLTE